MLFYIFYFVATTRIPMKLPAREQPSALVAFNANFLNTQDNPHHELKVTEPVELNSAAAITFLGDHKNGFTQNEMEEENLESAPINNDQDPELSNPLIETDEANLLTAIKRYIVLPINFMCHLTMADVRQEGHKNRYPSTFILSLLWMSFLAYFMVWMIVIIGHTLGIPDAVMGGTFIAAGLSVPDALSSIAVIKRGYGNMAVSNAIGSNIFDILICLGLPW